MLIKKIKNQGIDKLYTCKRAHTHFIFIFYLMLFTLRKFIRFFINFKISDMALCIIWNNLSKIHNYILSGSLSQTFH